MANPRDPSPHASWSVLLVAMIYPSLLTWMYFVALAGHEGILRQAVYGIGKLIQFGFPAVFFVVVLRQPLPWHLLHPFRSTIPASSPRPESGPLDSTGADSSSKFPSTMLGLGFGAIVLIAMLLLYYLVLKPWGVFTTVEAVAWEKVQGLGIDSVSRYAALALFYALGHSLLEEYYWRWFVFGQLRGKSRFSWAILGSSLAFMAHHVILLGAYFGWTHPLAWLFSAAVAVGGIFWAWLYERGHSLFGPWMSHLLIDAAIFLIGYDLLAQRFVSS